MKLMFACQRMPTFVTACRCAPFLTLRGIAGVLKKRVYDSYTRFGQALFMYFRS